MVTVEDLQKLLDAIVSGEFVDASVWTPLDLDEWDPEFRLIEESVDHREYIYAELNTKAVAFLEKSWLTVPYKVIETPTIQNWFDFVVQTKDVFEKNKTIFPHIKACADSLGLFLEQSWLFSVVEQQGIFINLRVNDTFYSDVVSQVGEMGDSYGWSRLCDSMRVSVEYSQPNLAKQMTTGHLRTTIVGEVLAQLYYNAWAYVMRWNYLWDWWTPFGKVVYALVGAYREQWVWLLEKIIEDPTVHLGALYIWYKDINDEEKDDKARAFFHQLEEGNDVIVALWRHIRKLSLIDFETIYSRLNVSFDTTRGEAYAFQNDQWTVVKDVEDAGYMRYENDVSLVQFSYDRERMGQKYLPRPAGDAIEESDVVMMLTKSDGASLYATRDVVLCKLRSQMQIDRAIYIVDMRQSLHFDLVFSLSHEIGYAWSTDYRHIGTWLITLWWEIMKSRQGNIFKLSQLLDVTKEKLSAWTEKEISPDTLEGLAVSAVVINDLKNDREKDIDFDLEKVIQLSGDSGIYLQYATVRLRALARDLGEREEGSLEWAVWTDQEKEMLIAMSMFPTVQMRALKLHKPHVLVQYLFDLAQRVNWWYGNAARNAELTDQQKDQRFLFIASLLVVFDNSFEILKVPHIEKI